MVEKLKASYQLLLLPPLAVIAGVTIARWTRLAASGSWTDAKAAGPVLFILSVVFGVAAPVLLRTLFAHRMRRRKSVTEGDFFRFQHRVIRWALLTPYLSCAACLLALPRFYYAGVVLATLYAVYYTYPSERRIDFDRRLFRVVGEARGA